MIRFERDAWALILGGSSGFGLATAKKLAREGMSVCVVHRDRRGAMARIEVEFAEVRACGGGFLALNLDALALEGRKQVLDELAAAMGDGKVRLLMHSIAFGNLKPLAPLSSRVRSPAAVGLDKLATATGLTRDALQAAVREAFEGGAVALRGLIPPEFGDALLEDEDMARTIHAMGTSLLTWVQDVFGRSLFAADARVLGLTSEGNQIAWRGYAAVSAAKAALESVSRSIALELGPHGIRSNIIQAGVTDTPALRLIPGSDAMRAAAVARNPLGRLTRPEDVAGFVSLMCTDEAGWVNGALLVVDGGERIAPA